MIDLGASLDARTTAVLMLLDLDGFKAYNDTFGHPAGDALLARIAEKLSAAVAERGRGLPHRRRRVLRPGRRRPGPSRSVRGRRGDVARGAGTRASGSPPPTAPSRSPRRPPASPRRCASSTARMYDEKDGRRASAGRQSRDVLLRVLYERDARLQGHLSGLVELVRAVGAGIGLSDDELADVTLAAELHEVGKLAIPDSILRKPGPLSDEEWQLRPPPPADRRADPVVRPRPRQGVGARPLDPRAHGRRGLPGSGSRARTSPSARASSAPARPSSR